MAEALLGVAVEATISKVMAIAVEQINMAWDFQDELQKLRNTLELVNTYLQDAKQRKRSTDPPVKLWLQGLGEIASEADDLLEDIRYESLRRRVEVGTKLRKKVSNFFSAHNPIAFRVKMVNRIKDINASFTDKNSKASQLGLQARLSLPANHADHQASQIVESHGFIGDSQSVVGREADLSKVVDLLIQSSTSSSPISLPVVTVVGMPGVGKTELAKLVFNDDRLRSQFDARIWVCVSETFDVKIILKHTLECLTDENITSFESKHKMLMKLHEKLADKKFLLVLDDVWNKDIAKWNELLEDLSRISRKAAESAILATTRDMEVAITMGSSIEFTCQLAILEDEACWSIIKATCGIASSSDNLHFNNLEKIGRDIARKCEGLPLLAKVIGGTLRKERSEKTWASILKSDIWEPLISKDRRIVRVLQLSFDRLGSPCLKKCFAYCSMFWDDHRFLREDLIQLWMAAGFIHPSADQTAWSVGNQYFNDLVSTNLFQDIERDLHENIIACKMHDVIHSFAKSLSEAIILTSANASVPIDVSHICHLNLDGKETTDLAYTLKLANRQNLHSLFAKFNIFHRNGEEFTRLRILSFAGADIEELPNSIEKLKRLTYFDISRTAIKEIPRSFTRLYSLETLKLVKCSLKNLPEQLDNLVNLSHLVFDKKELVPVNVGRLTCLQTLPLFVVGSKRGHGIEELGSLTRLRGKLEIIKLELVGGEEEAKMANLVEKNEISELVLEWSSSRENNEQDEAVLEGLQPNSSLKGLKIMNYEGHKLPSWLSSVVSNSQPDPLGNLMELELKTCNNCEKLPSLGQLPNLTLLFISGWNSVRSIDKDFFCNGDFPSLKVFSLCDMESLEELMEVEPTRTFPSLEDLTFDYCPTLKGIPWTDGLPSLQHLEIRNCEELSYLKDGLSSFLQLKRLHISGCRKLKSIPSPWGVSTLENLTLTDCEELKSASELKNQSCHSLKHLKFSHCPSMNSEVGQMLGWLACLESLTIDVIFSDEVWEFAQFFSSLKFLGLDGYKEGESLKSLPHQIQELTALKKLLIANFPSLEDLSEWCRKLHSLREICIYKCPNLRNVQCLSQMQQLKVMYIAQDLDHMDDFPPYFDSIFESSPPFLEELYLSGSLHWTHLPSQLQYLTALKKLDIWLFGKMEALPELIGNLSSLEHLRLYYCENLMYMPPQYSMQSLSKLKYLIIINCPKLEERCMIHIGPEWPKISHIPFIQFNKDIIQDI